MSRNAAFGRRRLFGYLGAGLAVSGLGGLAGCGDRTGSSADVADQTARLLRSSARLPEPFTREFRVPPVKKPIMVDGAAHYDVVQRSAEVEILPGLSTPVMGYDGLFPGPTFDTRRAQPVVITQHNELTVPTVTHLHGGHTPSESDGYPTDVVIPSGMPADRLGGAHPHGRPSGGDVRRGSRDYRYPNDQPAATLWYHDHRLDYTGPQVWRGLAGFHLIRDEIEDNLPLPRGDRELPLMIMDRAFDADGALRYPSLDPSLMLRPGVQPDYMSGVLGDVILVNGVPWPRHDVDAARYRLRVLNASNARRYRLRLDPPPPQGSAFVQIGSDGGLLERPVDHETLTVAPSERFDVLVDFAAYPVGTEVRLLNDLGAGATGQVMTFVVVRKARDDSAVPARLARIDPLVCEPDAVVREWRFTRSPRGGVRGQDGWLINNLAFDPGRIDARIQLGRTEIWRFYSDLHHAVHVHLAPFQVRSRGGGQPGPTDAGWKDTIDLRPAEWAEVAIRFERYAGRYLIHCHNLEHEDMMMMAAFETVS